MQTQSEILAELNERFPPQSDMDLWANEEAAARKFAEQTPAGQERIEQYKAKAAKEAANAHLFTETRQTCDECGLCECECDDNADD